MRKSNIDHTDREGMIATSFLILYLLFSYLLVYWTKTVSDTVLTRENLIINVFMYVIPCLIVMIMVFARESTLNSLGLNKGSSLWILGLLILSLVFYTQNITVKVILVVISEEIIFRGYAADRLRASFGNLGSIVVAGIIIGLMYSLIPFVNQGITTLEFGMYISAGIGSQLVLQKFYHHFGSIMVTIILHTGILLIAL